MTIELTTIEPRAISDGAATHALTLPPLFSGAILRPDEDAFAHALRAAADGPGALFVGERRGMFEIAVALAPEEPLRSARRAVYPGMLALAQAVGANAPSEMPLAIDWPDTLVYDGARLGGGRLAWPDGCAEDETPRWMVFGVSLIASKAAAGDPGLTPGSTSLEDEGFVFEGRFALVESFARHLMKAFEIWDEDGFEAVAARCLGYLAGGPGEARRIDRNGDGLGGERRFALAPALAAVAWRDPATGGVRL
jgi:hypothetical protein